jgi:hypothetical protein
VARTGAKRNVDRVKDKQKDREVEDRITLKWI